MKESAGFPACWVQSAIPYRQLKRILKKLLTESQIQAELEGIGLDSAALAQLHRFSLDEGGHRGSGVVFQYCFERGQTFVPKLTFWVDFSDGKAVNAALTPTTRSYLKSRALKRSGDTLDGHVKVLSTDFISSVETAEPDKAPHTRRVEVPLTFDAEFFSMLQDEVGSLARIQVKEQQALIDDIKTLSKSLSGVAMPAKYSTFQKSDHYRWRELFAIYVQSSVFFSTNEADHGSRDSTAAANKLRWFQDEVVRKKIASKFKLPASHKSLLKFIKINIDLLKNLKFQEINKQAIIKILKKFDKRTNFGAGRKFPELILSESIISESIARAVCQQLTQDLVKIVPQLEDYACPICSDICWRPIRFDCQHLLCIRCTIILQRQRPKALCPLCRDDVIMKADVGEDDGCRGLYCRQSHIQAWKTVVPEAEYKPDNIDKELSKFLKKNFRKEVLTKQIQNETEYGKERFGILYTHPSESSCCIQ
ncbi:RING/U-box [Diplocarpon rosae]|nr:RING/U-box [Diplocarpon rosae]